MWLWPWQHRGTGTPGYSGDTVKYSANKQGKLIKIGRKNVIVLRDDNHKERRLKVAQFIKYNF